MSKLYKSCVCVCCVLLFMCFYALNFNLPVVFAEHNFSDISNNTVNISFSYLNTTKNINLLVRKDAEKYVLSNNIASADNLSLFLKKTKRKGIMPTYALEFCFEDFSKVVMDLMAEINLDAQNAELVAIKNTGNIKLKNAICGREVDKKNIINNIFNTLANKNNKIMLDYKIITPNRCDDFFAGLKNIRGHFYTTYSSSSPERKHNIETALAKFDGLTLESNEILSFNQTTGRRSEENGYLGAKIISNGEFIDGLGGGVCQASTTLYNACLVGGLEVLEANQHSLKVGYIAPSFDAMVNFGSSDLKVKNNTGAPITFATKCDGNRCEVFIYGTKNEYEIKRRSEVLIEKPPEIEEVVARSEDDYDFNEDGYFYKIYPKSEVISEGYLDYYLNGKLEKSIKIRHNKYNAVKGVKIVKNAII